MSNSKPPAKRSSKQDIAAFLDKAKQVSVVNTGDCRLMVAIDATASRQPSWDRACHLQASMFTATKALQGLSIKLAYYRGFNEFHSLPWIDNSVQLREAMLSVSCLGGHTQIKKVLTHALEEHRKQPVKALVLVGDAFEEHLDDTCQLAGQLGLVGLPAYLFQEGYDPVAANAFRQIAQLSRGAHCQFDENSAGQLEQLLTTIAVYASGGNEALQTRKLNNPLSRQLLERKP